MDVTPGPSLSTAVARCGWAAAAPAGAPGGQATADARCADLELELILDGMLTAGAFPGCPELAIPPPWAHGGACSGDEGSWMSACSAELELELAPSSSGHSCAAPAPAALASPTGSQVAAPEVQPAAAAAAAAAPTAAPACGGGAPRVAAAPRRRKRGADAVDLAAENAVLRHEAACQQAKLDDMRAAHASLLARLSDVTAKWQATVVDNARLHRDSGELAAQLAAATQRVQQLQRMLGVCA
ncbi:hypothetical protein HT031_006743 [Scenedesmus sp. PABB004]|nr:hypothetical protein HT031_006743 [Scenedesmus sp. PABB004]